MKDIIINIFLAIKFIIFLDIILSWVSILANKELSIPYISQSLRTIYLKLSDLIPLSIAWLNFAPVILVVWLSFLENLLLRIL